LLRRNQGSAIFKHQQPGNARAVFFKPLSG